MLTPQYVARAKRLARQLGDPRGIVGATTILNDPSSRRGPGRPFDPAAVSASFIAHMDEDEAHLRAALATIFPPKKTKPKGKRRKAVSKK